MLANKSRWRLAGAAAVGTGILFHAQQPIVIVGLADLAATIVIFIFSVITKNSSMYDPYWSVAPVIIALFWLLQPGSDGFANARHVLIFALLCLWAIRLTANWADRWRGLGWRRHSRRGNRHIRSRRRIRPCLSADHRWLRAHTRNSDWDIDHDQQQSAYRQSGTHRERPAKPGAQHSCPAQRKLDPLAISLLKLPIEGKSVIASMTREPEPPMQT